MQLCLIKVLNFYAIRSDRSNHLLPGFEQELFIRMFMFFIPRLVSLSSVGGPPYFAALNKILCALNS